jgi:AAA domain
MSGQLATTWQAEQIPPIVTVSPRAKKTVALPALIDATELLSAELPKPPELVSGLLHRGSKLVIGGGSKSFKTWTLLDLGISVATGKKWWGFNTTRGRVVYMNFEIQNPFFKARLNEILLAKGCSLDKGQFSYWGLRGKAANLDDLMPRITEALRDGDYSLIIFDPIYKGLGGRDENKAGDVASLLNELESLAVETGAAVAFGHHFSKGNQSGKESIDRIGGSGVFARDPDTIITMTKHDQEDAFVIDPILRNFPPVEPFVVRRQHPLMVPDDALDPKRLKTANRKQQKYSDEAILASLDKGPLTTTQWQKDAMAATGISASGFMQRMAQLTKDTGPVKKHDKVWIKK